MSAASPKRKPLINKDSSPFRRLAERTVDTGDQALKEAREIEVRLIAPNPDQPRRYFDEVSLRQLADDIEVRGILQPLIVRPWQGENGEEYQLVVGERRFRAAKMIGLDRVPALVRELADQEVQIISLIENIQREDLDIGDEANYFKTLKEQFDHSIREIAALVNKSKSYVEVRLKLADNPALLDSVRSGKIGVHSAALAARLGASGEDESVREKDTLLQKEQSVREKDTLSAIRYPIVRPFRRLTDMIKNTAKKIEKATPDEQDAVLATLDELENEISQLRKRLNKTR